MTESRQLETVEAVWQFMTAGSAVFTLVSKATGNRFTYRVRKPRPNTPHFVGVLTGQDNVNHYEYLGTIFMFPTSEPEYRYGTARSRIGHDAPSAVVFQWFWNKVRAGVMPPQLEVWHEGRCGRCGRRLTVPESIARGIGPECAGRMK